MSTIPVHWIRQAGIGTRIHEVIPLRDLILRDWTIVYLVQEAIFALWVQQRLPSRAGRHRKLSKQFIWALMGFQRFPPFQSRCPLSMWTRLFLDRLMRAETRMQLLKQRFKPSATMKPVEGYLVILRADQVNLTQRRF